MAFASVFVDVDDGILMKLAVVMSMFVVTKLVVEFGLNRALTNFVEPLVPSKQTFHYPLECRIFLQTMEVV